MMTPPSPAAAVGTGLRLDDVAVGVPGRTLIEGVNLSLSAGIVAIMGPSGSGKSTLLNAISGIGPVRSGSVILDGTDLTRLSEERRSEFRLRHIGIVFQFGELLPELSVLHNVALPSLLAGVPRKAAEVIAAAMLDELGLARLSRRKPETLSGGEIQHVGVARALARNPLLVLADEPTGMLDDANTAETVAFFFGSCRRLRIPAVVATHDAAVASATDRVMRIENGRLVDSEAAAASLA